MEEGKVVLTTKNTWGQNKPAKMVTKSQLSGNDIKGFRPSLQNSQEEQIPGIFENETQKSCCSVDSTKSFKEIKYCQQQLDN